MKTKSNDYKAISTGTYKGKSTLFKNIVKNSTIKYNNSSILKSRNRSKTVWNIVKYELGIQNKDNKINEQRFSVPDFVNHFNNHHRNITRSLNLTPNSEQAIQSMKKIYTTKPEYFVFRTYNRRSTEYSEKI